MYWRKADGRNYSRTQAPQSSYGMVTCAWAGMGAPGSLRTQLTAEDRRITEGMVICGMAGTIFFCCAGRQRRPVHRSQEALRESRRRGDERRNEGTLRAGTGLLESAMRLAHCQTAQARAPAEKQVALPLSMRE